jgi:hypothetical protein
VRQHYQFGLDPAHDRKRNSVAEGRSVMDEQLRTVHRVYGEVVARALTDPTYRAALEADPRATLEAAGMPLPPEGRIVIVDEPPTGDLPAGTIPFLLLPPTSELSSEELESVAAGVCAESACGISTVSTIILSLSTIGCAITPPQ